MLHSAEFPQNWWFHCPNLLSLPSRLPRNHQIRDYSTHRAPKLGCPPPNPPNQGLSPLNQKPNKNRGFPPNICPTCLQNNPKFGLSNPVTTQIGVPRPRTSQNCAPPPKPLNTGICPPTKFHIVVPPSKLPKLRVLSPKIGITQPPDPPKLGFPLVSLGLPHTYSRFPFSWSSLIPGCPSFLPLPLILGAQLEGAEPGSMGSSPPFWGIQPTSLVCLPF